jgi:hypothetical protein
MKAVTVAAAMIARRLFGCVLLSLLLGGCLSPVQQASAGSIGCPPGEIVVADVKDGSWSATCRGRKFWCSPGEPASCTEELPKSGGPDASDPIAPATPTPPDTPEPAEPAASVEPSATPEPP